VITIDENGKKKFLDRTLTINKDKPMRKTMNIDHFSIYWNSNESEFIKDDERMM